jgi:hypothetical protein
MPDELQRIRNINFFSGMGIGFRLIFVAQLSTSGRAQLKGCFCRPSSNVDIVYRMARLFRLGEAPRSVVSNFSPIAAMLVAHPAMGFPCLPIGEF